MASKLFVGNLSFNVSDAQLNELFSSLSIPVANLRVMRDMDTGRSRGFAFAELAPEADMASAIQALNGKVIDGRALTVNEARPQKKKDWGGGGGNSRRDRGDFGGRGPRDGDRPRRKRGPELY